MGVGYRRSLFRQLKSVKILLVLLIGLSLDNGVHSHEIIANNDSRTCTSAECNELAWELRSQIKEDYVSCTDFYQFVCEKWHSLNPIPPKNLWWDQFIKTEQTLSTYVRGVLESDSANDSPTLTAAKEYHKHCMNIERIKTKGVSSMLEIFSKTPGWPLMKADRNWKDGKAWKEMEMYLSNLTDTPSFFGTEFVDHDGTFVLSIKQPDFLLPAKVLASTNMADIMHRQTYRQMIRKIVLEIALPEVKENVATLTRTLTNDISDMLSFEIELAKIVLDPEHPKLEGLTTVGQFQRYYNSQLKFTKYWEARGLPPPGPKAEQCLYKLDWMYELRGVLDLPDSQTIHSYTPLLISSPLYFADLCELLEKTPDKVIMNYVGWHFVRNLLPHLEGKATDILLSASKIIPLTGLQDVVGEDRCHKCIAENAMKDILYFEMLRKHFPDEKDDKIIDIILSIDSESRRQFLKAYNTYYEPRMNTMIKIKAPNYYKDLLDITSVPLETVSEDYVYQYLAHRRYKTRQSVEKLLQIVDPDPDDKWIKPVWKARIVKDIFWHNNSIEIPALGLQPPFYHETYPLSYVYGALGAQIAQQTTEILNRYFGSTYGTTNFNEHSAILDCYRTQSWGQYPRNIWEIIRTDYSGPPGMPQSRSTSHVWSHKIQDALGLDVAYQTYKRFMRTRSITDTKLPNLENYSDDQLFFIGFANAFCEVPTTLRSSVHAPWKPERIYTNSHMVNMAVMNNKHFGKAFGCPLNAAMNPTKKCTFWKDVSRAS